MSEILILKTIVGSQAHGLADEKSDTDYRGVFVIPTSELVCLGSKYKSNGWIEGNVDETTYELGHFLHLAIHCNASILEVFKAPQAHIDIEGLENIKGIQYHNFYGQELRALFPYVWEPKKVFLAFCGYSKNQETKMLDDKTEYTRVGKFACAYLRTLYNLEQLLSTGDFTLDVTHNPELYQKLKSIRAGDFNTGDIVNEAKKRKKICSALLEKCNHKPDLEKVNQFLLKVRKECW